MCFDKLAFGRARKLCKRSGRMESFHARSISSSCVRTEYAWEVTEQRTNGRSSTVFQAFDRNEAFISGSEVYQSLLVQLH